MYACWESMIVCLMKLWVILILSNQVQGPKSVSLYISFELADQFLRASSDQAIIDMDSQDDDSPIRPLLDESTMVSFCALESQFQECFQ